MPAIACSAEVQELIEEEIARNAGPRRLLAQETLSGRGVVAREDGLRALESWCAEASKRRKSDPEDVLDSGDVAKRLEAYAAFLKEVESAGLPTEPDGKKNGS